jgi:predicted AlkP superfamily phosphohydrolase/phosphomutase
MPRTLLLGIDGATFSLLDPMVDEGVMPFFASMVEAGVRCDLASTVHPYTPDAWTSLATGCTPGQHGIFDFVRVLGAERRPTYALATARDVRRETIWSISSRHGHRAACLNFPVMYPPRPLNGVIVPGFVPPRHLGRFVYPPSLYERLQALPGYDARELLLNLDLERTPTQRLPHDRYEDWIRVHIRREAQWTEITDLVLREEACDLVGVIFDGADKLQHVCWRFLDPELFPTQPSRWERRIREVCLEYYRRLDEHLERLCASAGSDARVVVCSDHGFGPTREIFYVNVLLAQHGFLRWAAGASPDRDQKHMIDGHRNPSILFDWDGTSAYAFTAGCNGVYIRVGDDSVPPSEYEELRRRVANALLSFRDPETGGRVVRRVLTREEAFPGTETARAPDLTLLLRDRGFLSILNADAVLKPRAEIVGTHHPHGVFVATGIGFRRGVVTAPFAIQDVAAILLHSTGVPIPEDLEARLPVHVFDPDWIAAHPPQRGAPTEPPERFFDEGPEQVLDDAGQAQVLGRLRALGYVE